MNVITEISKKIKVQEDERWVVFEMDSDWKCVGFDTNMPYEKTSDDWEFYAKAIKAMLKKL